MNRKKDLRESTVKASDNKLNSHISDRITALLKNSKHSKARIYWFAIDGLTQYAPDGITEYRYRVTETPPETEGKTYFVSYSREQDGAHERIKSYDDKQYIINRYPVTDIRITKEWRDSFGGEVKEWPESKTLTLSLYRKAGDGDPEKIALFEGIKPGDNRTSAPVSSEDAVQTGTVQTGTAYILNSSTSWPFTFEVDDLPSADGSGNSYLYYFTEEKVPGYAEPVYGNGGEYLGRTDAAYPGGKIINAVPSTEFVFHKIWHDAFDKDVAWPKNAEIKITLYSGTDTQAGEAVLSETGGTMDKWQWTGEKGEYSTSVTFRVSGLPAVDADGNPLSYYVKETGVEHVEHHEPSYCFLAESEAEEGEADASGDAEQRSSLKGLMTGHAADGQFIVNKPKNETAEAYELPSTGGTGTRPFMILGAILSAGAGVLLWRRRRLI